MNETAYKEIIEGAERIMGTRIMCADDICWLSHPGCEGCVMARQWMLHAQKLGFVFQSPLKDPKDAMFEHKEEYGDVNDDVHNVDNCKLCKLIKEKGI